jgi:hypothetical protein
LVVDYMYASDMKNPGRRFVFVLYDSDSCCTVQCTVLVRGTVPVVNKKTQRGSRLARAVTGTVVELPGRRTVQYTYNTVLYSVQ